MIETQHWTNQDGCPDGGTAHGVGLLINWQRGALIDDDGAAIPRNGAFVEEVIAAAIDRLEYYQRTKFACEENADAIADLKSAYHRIRKRQQRRTDEGTVGTHQPDAPTPRSESNSQ